MEPVTRLARFARSEVTARARTSACSDSAVAIAGSLAAKKTVPASVGTFPTTGCLFVGLVVGVILIMGGLTFFPSLALGPIVEHLSMLSGALYPLQ